MKISLVIPAYNEEKNIKNTVAQYKSYLESHFDSCEIIVVDDGSEDNTARAVKDLDGVTLISYKPNKGKGYAVKRGVLRATGDYIFFTDADLSYAPNNISAAIRVFEGGDFAAVIGRRRNDRQGYPLYRRLASQMLKAVTSRVLKMERMDTQCGFKGFRKDAARSAFAGCEIRGFGFDLEIMSILKAEGKGIASIDVEFCHRSESRVSLVSDSLRMLGDIMGLRQKRSGRREKLKGS